MLGLIRDLNLNTFGAPAHTHKLSAISQADATQEADTKFRKLRGGGGVRVTVNYQNAWHSRGWGGGGRGPTPKTPYGSAPEIKAMPLSFYRFRHTTDIENPFSISMDIPRHILYCTLTA